MVGRTTRGTRGITSTAWWDERRRRTRLKAKRRAAGKVARASRKTNR